MQISSSAGSWNMADGTTSPVLTLARPSSRAEQLRQPRLAHLYVVDGRRQQQEVVAIVRGILLGTWRHAARPAATRVRKVGRDARAPASGRVMCKAMCGARGRRGSGRWCRRARLGCSGTVILRCVKRPKFSKTRPLVLHCVYRRRVSLDVIRLTTFCGACACRASSTSEGAHS